MTDGEEIQSPRRGQIVTFYSFKGGTGRTMALANVAWILAANGKRVLVADWDLESPGLHRFFQPFLDANVGERPGIVDFVRRYEWAAVDAEVESDRLHDASEESRKEEAALITAIVDEHIGRVGDYAIPLSWEFPDRGVLHFLSSGKQTNGAYQATLGALDWDNFYDKLHGGQFFDALRAYMKSTYDYVLIDSRTGLSDVADICTVHLPDVVVDCFTLATQGIEGAAMIARLIQDHHNRGRDITIFPVPMRIDHTQQENVDAGLALAIKRFEGLPAGMSDDERSEYWAEVEVPYRPSYAYEEMLATIGDRVGSQGGLLPSYERLAARITNGAVSALPPKEEWLRLRTRLLFSRTQSRPSVAVLDFSPRDQLWAEWIAAVLASAEITVRWVSELPLGPDDADAETQTIAVVSESYIARMQDSPPAIQPDLLISVTDARLPPEFAGKSMISLVGLSEAQAVARLNETLRRRQPASQEAGIAALRYPGGNRPQVLNPPVRNVNFTGRDKDLKNLRDQLETRDVTVPLPLTVQGLGGVGKTQLAMEYAHRFRADYDIIWWMNCGQAQYVDASLVDLGQQLRDVFKADIPEEGGVAEIVQRVLGWLSEDPSRRWLLVYDNADDIGEIKPLLPFRDDSTRSSGGGHVLITSTNKRWTSAERLRSLEVGAFERGESIDHLRRRVPGISEAEADDLARVLGDMPLAVAAAGALLATAEIPVAEYLRQLRRQPEPDLAEAHPLRAYPPDVWKAWNLSLDYLQGKSAAAARLLGICSVMAPDISLELISSQAMADNLRDLDPTISERAMITRLIRQIDLLALIKLDNNAQQIQVHRVVQSVVNGRLARTEKTAARRAVHQIVVAARPEGDVDDSQTWPRYRMIWPHLTPSGAMWSADTAVRELLIERVRYIWIRDDLDRGLRRAREIERAWTTMLAGRPDPEVPGSQEMVTGELEPEVAESLQRQLYRLQFNLANILRSLAEFQDARALDEAVLSGQREHLGEEHLHTLQTRSSLAGDMRALGEYSAALTYDLETYRLFSSGYGEDYRGTLSAAHNLALSHLLTGDFRLALAQDRQTYARRRSVLGPLHPRTFNSGTSIARDLLEAGRYNEATAQAETVWNQSRVALGDNDRNTLNTQLLFGVAQRCAGRPDLAQDLIEAARDGLSSAFGPDSTDALASRLSQGLNWLALEQYPAGMAAAEGVLVVYEDRLGAEHPHALICRLNISTALYLQGDYQAAQTEAQYAADRLSERLGSAHPYTLAARMMLASVLARQGGLAEARELEEELVRERDDRLGSPHPDTLRAQLNLLLTEHELRVAGALEKRQEIIAALGSRIGANHPDVTTAMNGGRLLSAIDPLPF
jgi:MinD-like ATPase involved in chromosome partitioning or flagellar assembly/tetratricopeptide (TPR) repeat protein